MTLEIFFLKEKYYRKKTKKVIIQKDKLKILNEKLLKNANKDILQTVMCITHNNCKKKYFFKNVIEKIFMVLTT